MNRYGRIYGFVLLALSALALFVSACILGGPCTASVYTVTKVADTDDGACSLTNCSLRDAVIASNSCPGTQTIDIPAGTYVLTRIGPGENAAATGDLDITDSVIINGTGNPVIDGNHADRVFEIFAGVTANMNGLVIQNGYSQNGAGILNHGTLQLNNSVVQNNVASLSASASLDSGLYTISARSGGGGYADGGGILSEDNSTLTLNTVTVTNNSADQGGGIMVLANGTTAPTFTFDSPTLYGATVSHNTASLMGGGLWLDNQVHASLHMFMIDHNTASTDRGGGIYNASILTLNQGAITNNSSETSGGGIYNEPAGDVTATEVFLGSNQSGAGGAVYNKGPARFYQSGLDNNTASSQGGGIYNSDTESALTVQNTTLSGNSAPTGGGIRNDNGSFQIIFGTIANNTNDGINGSGSGEMTMRNSIIAGNSSANCTGTSPASNGFNIDSGNSCGFIEPSDLVNTDPMILPLAKNGGWSPTHALAAGSPAIDSADPDRCDGTDEREVPRPQGAGCDRGAFERQASDGALVPGPTATSSGLLAPTVPAMIQIILTQNANCRKGPGVAYDVVTPVLKGVTSNVQGRNTDSTWVVIQTSDGSQCWVILTSGTPNGSLDPAPVVTPPPLPDTPATFKDSAACDPRKQSFSVTLTWTVANNATGYYLFRNKKLLTTLTPGTTSTYVDSPPAGRTYSYSLEAYNDNGVSAILTTEVSACVFSSPNNPNGAGNPLKP